MSDREKQELLRLAAAHRARLDAEKAAAAAKASSSAKAANKRHQHPTRRLSFQQQRQQGQQGSDQNSHHHQPSYPPAPAASPFSAPSPSSSSRGGKSAPVTKVINGVEYERVGGGWAPLNPTSALWQPRDAIRLAKKMEKSGRLAGPETTTPTTTTTTTTTPRMQKALLAASPAGGASVVRSSPMGGGLAMGHSLGYSAELPLLPRAPQRTGQTQLMSSLPNITAWQK